MDIPTPEELKYDLALLVMSTVCFNAGIGARDDRAPEDVERLALASQRVCMVFNIEFTV